MKTIKSILKPFLRIFACLMYIPLFLLSIVYTVLAILFLLVCALISFIVTGDSNIIPDIVFETEIHEDVFQLFDVFDEKDCIVLNYNTLVFDKINEL